ncbi:unnamed protein product, partial [Laminaria digitata]
ELGSPLARQGKLLRSIGMVSLVLLLVAMWVGAPWGHNVVTEDDLVELRTQLTLREQELQSEYDQILSEIRLIEDADSRLRVKINEVTNGQFAPTSQTLSDQLLHMSQIVRQVQPNTMGVGEKLGVYFSRWWEYLSTFPREANTEGGVYPVIVGTVLLTVLLTIVVTPMGVIAALYLREYAKQGIVTSMIRIAVNNLAGVPSIVYGVFGLGFFCYTVGSYVDVGPSPSTRLSVSSWWTLLVITGAMVILGVATRLWSKPDPGKLPSRMNILLQRVSWLVWAACV